MKANPRTISLADTTLTYHVTQPDSSGQPTVFLHPWFGCWQFWESTMAGFDDRPCYAVDFYSPAAGAWSEVANPTALAAAVLEMLDTEGIEQVDLVGNSVGGIVAQIIASAAPERVRRLVLIGTGASTEGALPGFAAVVDRWTSVTQSSIPARKAVEDTVQMLFTTRPEDEVWETYIQAVLQTDPDYIGSVLKHARTLDLTSRLPEITAPTLIVRGSEDCARTAEHAAILAAGIPTARAVEMAGAGHSPMVDHPAEFFSIISSHLGRRSGSLADIPVGDGLGL